MKTRIRGCLWKAGVNGLGVRGFHLLPYRKRFDIAAREHDRGYDMAGGWQTRRFFDIRFLEAMVRACHTDQQCTFAMVYFVAVRAFGWLFYRYDRQGRWAS